MEIAFLELDPAQAAFLITPGILIAAAGIWLTLATGLVGRAALYLEERAHRPATDDKGAATYC